MSKCFRFRSTLPFAVLLLLVQVQSVFADPQSFHIIDINEIYSNADGTKQFVELIAGAEFQTSLSSTWIISKDATGTITDTVFDFTGSFPALNTGETILLATQAFADDVGFAPDFVIPPNSLFLGDGRVIFEDPPPGATFVDAIAYGDYTGSNTNYGLPADALPNDGCHSLQRTVLDFSVPDSNNINWAVSPGGATPRRNNGTTVTLPCAPVAPVLAAIGAKNVNEGQLLSFGISATDGNADPIVLTAENLPSGANFTNNGNGTGSFSWTPTFLQSTSYNVLFIASDGGLADSENVTITVNEVTNPPNAVCQDVQVDADSICNGVVAPSAVNNGSSDPEGGALTFQLQPPGPYALGNTAVILIVTDPFGAKDTCAATITMVDTSDPVMTCPNDTTVNIPTGTAPVVVNYELPHTIENCGAPGLVCTPASGSSFPVGATLVTCIASDNAGNADTCTFTVTVNEVACSCPCHADPTCDGDPTVLDVVNVVGIAFRNGTDTIDPGCSHIGRTDTNCDCVVTILDVVNMVAHAFRNDQTPFCNPCNSPCP